MLPLVFVISVAVVVSCDFRSGTAKEKMEKFSGSPTPPIPPVPTPTPVDPGDIVQVDTTVESETLTVDGDEQKRSVTCNKFDRVMVNGNSSVISIKGACRQVIINGDRNQIAADAAAEFIFNGTDNSLTYVRYVNGKRPAVTQGQPGNLIEKTAFEPDKTSRSQTNGAK